MNSDLIYDVGANNGDDTAAYLSWGYRVVAIEADPELADQVSRRFASEVADGRLHVLNVGVAEESGTFPFYVNSNRKHSSFDPEFGKRGGRYHVIDVPGVSFAKVLAEYGVPFYLKVDIEGADKHCINCLDRHDLPQYVSVEAHRLSYLATLHELGYRKFKVIDQLGHNHPRSFDNRTLRGRLSGTIERYRRGFMNHNPFASQRYAPGSSGPFGEESPGEWRDLESVAYDWLHFATGNHSRGPLNRYGWFDFHASR